MKYREILEKLKDFTEEELEKEALISDDDYGVRAIDCWGQISKSNYFEIGHPLLITTPTDEEDDSKADLSAFDLIVALTGPVKGLEEEGEEEDDF